MNKFKELEGVICNDRFEAIKLAKLAEEKGYKISWLFFNKPKYKNIIFYKGEFVDAINWAITYPITKEEFINRL